MANVASPSVGHCEEAAADKTGKEVAVRWWIAQDDRGQKKDPFL